MSKRKNVITSEQLFNFNKPKYNGFGCGHGFHGNNKYSRKEKHRKDWKDCLNEF